MAKFRILSIDGGGLRGIVPLRILQEVEKITGKKIYELFDMVAGTSTGGLISTCLTIRNPSNPSLPKYSVDDLFKLYVDNGHIIFPPRNPVGKLIEKAANLLHPEFSANGLEQVLASYVHGERIKDALLPVVVPCYDVSSNSPLFFKTSEAAGDESANALVHDVCRATSAAPTFLPAFPFNHKGQAVVAIDGGVYVNNPTMAAIAEIHKYGTDYYKQPKEVQLDDIVVFSIGTGSYSGPVSTHPITEWGQLQWITVISDIMMRGVNKTTDYEAAELLASENYLRLNIDIPDEKYADMADASPETRTYLLKLVEDMLTNKAEALKAFLQQI